MPDWSRSGSASSSPRFPATEPEIAVAERATDALEPAKDAAIEAVATSPTTSSRAPADAAQRIEATAADAAGTVIENAKQQAAETEDDAQHAAQR